LDGTLTLRGQYKPYIELPRLPNAGITGTSTKTFAAKPDVQGERRAQRLPVPVHAES
jgi:hypothetical protein